MVAPDRSGRPQIDPTLGVAHQPMRTVQALVEQTQARGVWLLNVQPPQLAAPRIPSAHVGQPENARLDLQQHAREAPALGILCDKAQTEPRRG